MTTGFVKFHLGNERGTLIHLFLYRRTSGLWSGWLGRREMRSVTNGYISSARCRLALRIVVVPKAKRIFAGEGYQPRCRASPLLEFNS